MLYQRDAHSSKYVSPDRGHILEIFHLENGGITDKGITRRAVILPWAEENSPPDTVGGIRLIFIESEGHDASLPFTSYTEFERTMQCMHLAGIINVFLGISNPFLGLGFPGDFGPQVTKISANQELDGIQAWIIRTFLHGQATFMISYNASSNMVSAFGIFWQRSWMLRVVEMIRKFKRYAYHPMLIPAIITSSVFAYHQDEWHDINRKVKELETRAGVRDFSDLSNEKFIADTQGAIRESVNLKARLADIIANLRHLDACMLDPILEGVHAVEPPVFPEAMDHPAMRGKVAVAGMDIKDQIQILKQQRVIMLSHIAALVTKTETTISALYSMFAQRDSKLNNQIAQDTKQVAVDSKQLAVDSKRHAELNLEAVKQPVVIASAAKRDTSSMKSIAVLTMAFLPGTFVASLLATPMVGWVPADLWKYWAITIPLTFMVLAIWTVYTSVTDRRVKKQTKSARNRLLA